MPPSRISPGPSGAEGPPPRPRAEAMSSSVLAEAAAAGVDEAGRRLLREALDLAMAPRSARLLDDHHPAFLHPGRTVLLMLREGGVRDPVALAAGALHESRDADLRVPADRVTDLGAGAVRDALPQLPPPDDPRLAERLVTLPPGPLVAVLAERLDQLRHEHLREPVVPWPELLEQTRLVWHPVAARAAPEMARRYAHWLRVFARRVAPPRGPSGPLASP